MQGYFWLWVKLMRDVTLQRCLSLSLSVYAFNSMHGCHTSLINILIISRIPNSFWKKKDLVKRLMFRIWDMSSCFHCQCLIIQHYIHWWFATTRLAWFDICIYQNLSYFCILIFIQIIFVSKIQLIATKGSHFIWNKVILVVEKPTADPRGPSKELM